jgi:hypothetical protein
LVLGQDLGGFYFEDFDWSFLFGSLIFDLLSEKVKTLEILVMSRKVIRVRVSTSQVT